MNVIFGAGQTYLGIGAKGKAQIKNDGKATCAVLFESGLPLQHQPVVPTLVQFTERIAQVIALFEAL